MIHERTLQALEFPRLLEYLATYCVSPAGKDLALALCPLPGTEDVRRAANEFRQAQRWLSQKDDAAFVISSFPDIRTLLRTASESTRVPDTEDFWALREVLLLAEKAVASLSQKEGEQLWPDLLQRAAGHSFPVQITAALQRCLSDDGHIKDESSPDLYLVRNELRQLHQNCMRKVKDFAIQYNILAYLQDEFMTLASDRYVLPLKANFKGRLQGIIHDWSQTGETCYFEPMFLVEINNKLQELKHREKEEERKVLLYCNGLFQQELPEVHNVHNLLCFLDLLFAKLRLAEKYNGHCVHLKEEENAGISLLAASHPLLVLAVDSQTKNRIQPLDILLRDGERGLIISGGNAGGKTVCLKTLGLIAAMTLSGLPAPVHEDSYIPAWTRIDAFIGDEQSLDDNVSTYTAQIRHLAKAWKYVGTRTLILLDEFGAGTDPTQGAALAQAVLDELLDKDAYVLAATHFPALKAYALTRDKARAASVLFDPHTKRPLFRLAYDQVGASQALDVAREHGLPESIIHRAEHYLLMEAEDSSTLLTRLNALAVAREKELDALKAEQEKQRRQKASLQERFENERRKLHDEIRTQASELLRAWKEGRATHKQTLKEMSRLRATLAPQVAIADERPVPTEFSIGQEILHTAFQKQGGVLELDPRPQKNGLT